MAQSNIDKTRIDNLEREVYQGKRASLPEKPKEKPPFLNELYAVLPASEKKYKPKKILYDF